MKFNFSVTEFQDRARQTESEAGATDGLIETFADRLLQPVEGETPEEQRERREFDRGAAIELVRGLLPVSQEVFLDRMKTCLSCEHVRIIAGRNEGSTVKIIQCTSCNCVMNAKARFRSSACPLGKFKAVRG